MLCGPVRTAIGAFNGSLKTVSATELGAVVVRGTLRRGGLDAGAIGSVVMGSSNVEQVILSILRMPNPRE